MKLSRVFSGLLLCLAACGDNQGVDQAAEVTHAPAVETTVNEDGSVSVTIPMVGDASAMSFAVSSKPSHGTVTGTGPQFLYHPGSDFSGKDAFRITATETATKKQTIVPVFIGIDAVNDPPSAHDDQFTTAEDTDLVIPASAVMANDVDVDSKLTVVAVTQPDYPTLCSATFGCSRPAVTLDGDQITYHPRHNFNGTETFTYTVSDGEYTSTATVAVRVTATNDAPYGYVLNTSLADDASYTISTADLADFSSDPDGDTTFVSGVSNAAGGTVTMVDDVVTFVPTKVAEIGEAGFDFTVSDGQLTGTGHVYFYVSHVNHAPVAVNDTLTLDQDTVLPFDPYSFVENDTDSDGDTLAGYIHSMPSHGELSGYDGHHMFYTPNPGFVGEDSFEYTANDGYTSTVGTVHITVKHVNHAPVANPGSISGDMNKPASTTLSATDSDNDELTYQVATAPQHGEVVFQGSTVTYTPEPDYSGEDSFEFTASDGSLFSEPTKVSITVAAANQPPVPDSQILPDVNECSYYYFTISATDPDTDTSQLTYALVGASSGQAWLSGTEIEYEPDCQLGNGRGGAVTITWTVTDDTNNTATGTTTFNFYPPQG